MTNVIIVYACFEKVSKISTPDLAQLAFQNIGIQREMAK